MKKFIIGLIAFVLLFMSSCTEQIQKEDYTFYAMDTMISISFYNVKNSSMIAKKVEEIYLQYDGIANDYKSDNSTNGVYDLNVKREIELSSELEELLQYSLEVYEETNHYFNPFIGRLSHLWKEALAQQRVLDSNLVHQEVEIMQNTSLEIHEKKARLIGDGNMDLGGIAKGYATSKAIQYLKSVSCDRYLLNAGNSTIALGNKNEKNFKVGISKALDIGYLTILNIKDKVISTSSIKEQHTQIDGKYYSHLLNSKTGYPAEFYEAISIIGEDSKALDAYSTACFSMELEEVKLFLDERGLDYIISKENQILYSSKGVASYA